jgi:hypothetical protein
MPKRSHGESFTRLYRIWSDMRQRCTNPRTKDWPRYGGRGITVCSEWGQYENFRRWAFASGYASTLTIDRLDNNLGYSPDNCRWADATTQGANRATTYIAPTGEPWWHIAKANGITSAAYQKRVSRGWAKERAASEPLRQQ